MKLDDVKIFYGVKLIDYGDDYGVYERNTIQELLDIGIVAIFIDKEVAQDYANRLGW